MVGRERVGVVPPASGTSLHRWEELHVLASEPQEQHVLLAEQVEDATNGLLSALSSSALCSAVAPGRTVPQRAKGLGRVGRFLRPEPPQRGRG